MSIPVHLTLRFIDLLLFKKEIYGGSKDKQCEVEEATHTSGENYQIIVKFECKKLMQDLNVTHRAI